jgi:hypothetical protein
MVIGSMGVRVKALFDQVGGGSVVVLIGNAAVDIEDSHLAVGQPCRIEDGWSGHGVFLE